MSDEFKNDDENAEEQGQEQDDFGALTGDDSGLGNLPPLTDFDSADAESSPGLPPMDSGDSSDSGEDAGGLPPMDNVSGGDSGGLPPIDDIRVDTPAERSSDLTTPEGGAKPVQTPDFDTPGAKGLDTPEPMSGLGFQDFAADSDFSPETPDIGPGPDSDLDTPMFDSAFGGDMGDFGSSGTPSPTRAMETPMFDAGPDTPTGPDAGDTGGFADFDTGGDSFGGGGTGGDELGTPIPDFSPDTGVPEAEAEAGKKKPKKAKAARAGGGGPGLLITVAAAVIALLIGAVIGAMGFVPGIPNPLQAELDAANQQVAMLQTENSSLEKRLSGGEVISEAEIAKRKATLDDLNAKIGEKEQALQALTTQVDEARSVLRTVQGDIEEKNGEFVTAQERLEELQQNLAITQARHEGLIAENQRLTAQVGELEVANQRAQATRDTLLHNLDLLIVQIEGGSPLAPQKYARQQRLDKAVELRNKVLNANWVGPELLNEYTQLYLDELAIAASREYFFAKIPVSDTLGTRRLVWAECLMNGNWSVYYRSIDGQYVGSFENVSNTVTPDYQFRTDLPSSVKSDIVDSIQAARVSDWEDKVAVLKQKQAVYEDTSDFQRNYNAL